MKSFNNNQLLVKTGLFINNQIKNKKLLFQNITKERILPVIFTNISNILSINYLVENQIGRWKLSNNDKIISIKVEQANEDHCGCCNFNQEKHYENEDYYRYFCS
jgi:hypothetical protein